MKRRGLKIGESNSSLWISLWKKYEGISREAEKVEGKRGSKKMEYRRDIAIVSLCLALYLTGCATRSEIVRFKEQIAYLEENNRQMTQSLSRLDSLARRQEQILFEMRADLNRGLDQLTERVQTVEGKLEDSGYRLGEISQKIESARVPDTLTKKGSGSESLSPDPKKLFDMAYLDLSRGNYDLALMGFQEFGKTFPQSELADDALYWTGECLFAQKKLNEAIAELEKVTVTYPKGDKAPASLYKIGLIYLELKEKKQAKFILQKLTKEYPRSPEAKLAKEKLASLR